MFFVCCTGTELELFAAGTNVFVLFVFFRKEKKTTRIENSRWPPPLLISNISTSAVLRNILLKFCVIIEKK